MALEPGRLVGEERAQLGQEPRLADPGLADEQEGLAAARLELGDEAPQLRDLVLAADERPKRGGATRSSAARRAGTPRQARRDP